MWISKRMLNITWIEHRSNVSILKTLGVQTRLSTICLRKTLEYFDHITRKDSSSIEKPMLTGLAHVARDVPGPGEARSRLSRLQCVSYGGESQEMENVMKPAISVRSYDPQYIMWKGLRKIK
ncbi:jg5118 [Pararge aegeria aegeria]|uniref:Jg5118 protein n=1 Tax=Pararge aegeria aegeria TaxID=348720 RepID=A0A8S4RYT3_9NEOP|nr:jg5118 [Pararge aegeria aegeria]